MAKVTAMDTAGQPVDFHTRDLILALEKEGNTYLTIRDTENPVGEGGATACPFAIFQAHIQTAVPVSLAGAVLKQYGPLVQIGVNPHYVNNVIDKMVVPYGVIMGLEIHQRIVLVMTMMI